PLPARGGVPEVGGAVLAAGRDLRTVGMERHGEDRAVVAERDGVAAGGQVPEPGRAVLAGAGERAAVGRKGQAVHRLGVVSDHEHDYFPLRSLDMRTARPWS